MTKIDVNKTLKQNKIGKELVSWEDHNLYLPIKFQIFGINTTCRILSMFTPDYNGGFWDLFSLSNGGFYLAPQLAKDFRFRIDSNGFEGTLSADAAGIVVSIFALGTLLTADSKELTNKYYLLIDFAKEHAEANLIFAAID